MGTVLSFLHGAVQRLRRFAYAQPERARGQRPHVGLALAGGFARGIAHIGILKVFQENQIPIDCIAGTSVGALVAAAYAAGVPLDQMERQAANTHFKDFGKWTLSLMGLASNERLERYLRRYSPTSRFEELKIPLAIAATDLLSGEAVYFTKGPLGPALRASCAYPGLFLPVDHEGRTLVDGFLASPVPVEAARQLGADLVIAVFLEAGGDEKPKNFAGVISRSFSIIQHHAHTEWRDKADLVIAPNVRKFGWDDFEKAPQLIAAGQAAAHAALPCVRAALAAAAAPAYAAPQRAYR